MANLSLETLLTGRSGFALTSATPLQRAICRCIDGLSLEELAAHGDVVDAFGGEAAVAGLPVGVPPAEIVLLAAIRTGKSLLAAACALRASQTCDVSGLGAGETPRVSVLSLRLDLAGAVFDHLVGNLQARPALRALMIGEPSADSVHVRHPSGRPIEIKVVAGARAGASIIARWSAGVIFDEAPRMVGAEDGVVNLADARNAAIGRLLPGAQILCIGSPWAPFGPVYELTQEHFGKPSERIIVVKGIGPAMNPRHWNIIRTTKLRLFDPLAYRTDVLCEFATPESGLLSPVAVHRNSRNAPLELPPVGGASYMAAGDLSDVGAGNAATLVIIQIVPSEPDSAAPKYRTALARQWRGVGIEACLRDMAADCKRYGLSSVGTDRYAGAANAALAQRFGLRLDLDAPTAQSNLEDFTNLATILHTDRLELPPDRVLTADLLSVRKQTTQTGYQIVLPKTRDGRHGDYAPAICRAVKRAADLASAAPRLTPHQRARLFESDSRWGADRGYVRGFG